MSHLEHIDLANNNWSLNIGKLFVDSFCFAGGDSDKVLIRSADLSRLIEVAGRIKRENRS